MKTGCSMALEHELATYRANLMEMLGDEGKFVVIRGDEVLGVWPTYEKALGAGYDEYGLEPFLVKKIQRVEPVHYFSRDLPR
jgi:hypothetical protein